jgi:hypothetical protein
LVPVVDRFLGQQRPRSFKITLRNAQDEPLTAAGRPITAQNQARGIHGDSLRGKAAYSSASFAVPHVTSFTHSAGIGPRGRGAPASASEMDSLTLFRMIAEIGMESSVDVGIARGSGAIHQVSLAFLDKRQLMWRRIRLSGRWPVQGCGGAYERLEGRLIYFITLMEIDSAPGVAFKAGVEQS